MKMRRTCCKGLFALGALGLIMLDPQYTAGQPGGGGGREFKFGPPPGGGSGGREYKFGAPPAPGVQPASGYPGGDRAERTFSFFSQGKDVIDFSRMDPNMRNFARSAFEKAGLPPPTDSTVITKAQFTESYNRTLAAKGMTPGGPTAPQPGASMTFRVGGEGERRSYGGSPGTGFSGGPPSGFNGGYNGGGSGWQGGGGNNSFAGGSGSSGNGNSLEREKMSGPTSFRMTDQDIERRFTDSDANRDGKLAYDELSERSPLRSSFQESDTNKDGSIDMTEYKAYIAVRFGGEGSDPNAGSYGSYAGNGNYGRENRDPRGEKQEQPVIAIRYGKLPSGLPSWWDALDGDKDGQIGLYEWRQDARDMKEFQKMDLDSDGVLAPQEWLRFNVLSAEQAKAIAAEEEIGGPGGASKSSGRPSFGPASFPGGSGPYPGGSKSGGSGKDKGSDKGDRERNDKDSKNPFRTGGKK